MSENGWLDTTALVSILSSRINVVCPVKSESTWGLILSARGGRFFDKREVEDIQQSYSRLEMQGNKKQGVERIANIKKGIGGFRN